MYKIFLAGLILCLCACGSDDQTGDSRKHRGPNAGISRPARPDPEKAAWADRMLEFANRSKDVLEHGFYSLPGALAANTEKYIRDWRLPPRPKTAPRQAANLVPDAGLFTEEEAADLARALEDMERCMSNVFGYYANLERYVRDRSIKDDGERGQELAEKISASNAGFMAARHSWLAIVNSRAEEAEKLLLAEHPLLRQIDAARKIFSQFKEIAAILATDTPQPEMLEACRQNLSESISEGRRPPFPASPALERPYREFLKKADACLDVLSRGILEGFHGAQRKELNQAMLECQNSYNAFAREANRADGKNFPS